MNFKIKMNSAKKILKDHGLDESGKVTIFLRDTVSRLCDPYIPMDSGTLKTSKIYPNSHSIKYVQPYSHYMYKGKKAIGSSRPKGVKRKISNQSLKYQGSPKRGAEWDKRMMNDKRKNIIKDVQNFIKNGGK